MSKNSKYLSDSNWRYREIIIKILIVVKVEL